MIRFRCSSCGFEKEVGDKYLNHRVRCPMCKTPNEVTAEQLQFEEPPKDIIKFRCPSCNQKIGVKSDYAGKRVKCAKCQSVMVVPSKEAKPKTPKPVEYTFTQPDDFQRDFERSAASSMSDLMNEVEDPFEGRAVARDTKSSDKNVILIIAAVCIVFVVGLAVVFIALSKMGDDDTQDVASVSESQDTGVDTYAAQDFAIDFIELLEQKKIDEAKELLVPILQSRINQDKVDKLAETLVKSDNLTLNFDRKYVDPDNGSTYYVLFYTLGGDSMDEESEEEQEEIWIAEDVWDVTVVILADSSELKVEGISIDYFFNEIASLKTARFDGVVEGAVIEVVTLFGSIGCGVFLVLGILFLITIISMCIVFSKAGQPAWAPLIPFYNMWVLAEIADKPGWMGLAVIFVGTIPIAGNMIQVFLHLSICIGVAEAFDKGFIFGIGLTFLPFIFYPILAFSKN